jgi:hypothetical protein
MPWPAQAFERRRVGGLARSGGASKKALQKLKGFHFAMLRRCQARD